MLDAKTISPQLMADLDRYRSGPKISDFSNWKSVPASAVVNPEDLSPEQQAGLARALKSAEEFRAGLHVLPPDRSRDFTDAKIREAISQADVSVLRDDQVNDRIALFSHVMQSGRMEEFAFKGRNGDQTTTSIPQFVIWLQERRDAHDDDGTYAPNHFKP